jgi:hypothetical protein
MFGAGQSYPIEMSLGDMSAFAEASEAVHFAGGKREEVYAWVGACLERRTGLRWGAQRAVWYGGIWAAAGG